jgi:uncharacterized protein YjbI with pentapeptide repeats
MTVPPSRDEEIRLIWTENQWLYMVVGFIAGLLFCLLTQLSVLNLPELVQSLIPEAAGILVTITVIDQLNRRRDERNAIKQLQEQLVRDASSTINDVANNAMHQLRKRGWSAHDNGLLIGADLQLANLQGANLEAANLQGAILGGANLQGAILRFANLQGTILGGAKLQGAKLWGANLRGANLRFAKLQEANLTRADLRGAYLREANLQSADLCQAKLQGANLSRTNLQEAELIEARLQGADLGEANLQGAYLLNAEFDENTILPDKSHWTPATDMTRFTQPDNEAGSLSNDEPR